MSVRVRLLGPPRLEGGGAPRPRGSKTWAVLARVALADRPVSRRELAGELFPEADDPLGALRWSVADVRRALGRPGVLRGDPLALPDDEVWVDVRALHRGALPPSGLGGELLEGVEPHGCPAFETWLLLERARTAARVREELRRQALQLLAEGSHEDAVAVAHRAVALDPLDEDAQELLLRALVVAGHPAQASVHLDACLALFAREGVVPSAALRQAARGDGPRPSSGLRAGVVTRSLLQAGEAALSAGAADAGVETLRRAAEEAARARDPVLEAEVLRTLGSALVHAVRGADGEGAVVLHRARALAQRCGAAALEADVLRELAFVDVQAGRHASASRALRRAREQAGDDEALRARVLAVQGMNAADRGRHLQAAALLSESAELACRTGGLRQQAWSLGVLARSLLLAGRLDAGRAAAEQSVRLAQQERWTAFLPWPQVLRAQALAEAGDRAASRSEAEGAFALACELRDPCWEGMAGRALGRLALGDGDLASARRWTAEARTRCDRVSDRYVWVSAYVALADLELAVQEGGRRVDAAARALQADAVRADLPEFLAWALVHRSERGEPGQAALARTAAAGVDNPALQARVAALQAELP